MSSPEPTNSSPIAIIIVIVAVIAGGAWAASVWWLPPIGEWGATNGAATADGAPADVQHQGITSLELSEEAIAAQGIEVRPLKRSTYERFIAVPARTITMPGVGRIEVTSPSSGVVEKILVGQGQMVTPGQPLFEIQLIHDEGIKVQFELLDALAEREVVDSDLKRMQNVERENPGTIQGTRILEKIYKRRHLNHLIASRRQMLILLGLPAANVDAMIKEHLDKQDAAPSEHSDFTEKLLLEKVVIRAPVGDAANRGPMVVEALLVVTGEHVEAGDKLSQLGDYQTLLIEGDGFERDIDAIRNAREKDWRLTAAIGRRNKPPVLLPDLQINDMALQLDAQARSAKFYVRLANELTKIPARGDQPASQQWRFLPGQRMELRLPTKLDPNVLKVPATAVARDGLNNYVFQVAGNKFTRRPVEVLDRDEEFVVLKENKYITDGTPVAINGAYQLQLALLNSAMDPAAVAHGHAH